jgi:hypothetical protein
MDEGPSSARVAGRALDLSQRGVEPLNPLPNVKLVVTLAERLW